MKEAVEHICEAFKITTTGTLKDYLGAKIMLGGTTKTTYINQPFILDKKNYQVWARIIPAELQDPWCSRICLASQGYQRYWCSSNIEDGALLFWCRDGVIPSKAIKPRYL